MLDGPSRRFLLEFDQSGVGALNIGFWSAPYFFYHPTASMWRNKLKLFILDQVGAIIMSTEKIAFNFIEIPHLTLGTINKFQGIISIQIMQPRITSNINGIVILDDIING